jgi:hypothetical protein
MTVTLVITVGLKWSITLMIFGSLLVQLADIFKEKRIFTALIASLSGVALLLASLWLFLEWLWSI